MSEAIARTSKTPVAMTGQGVQFSTVDEAFRMAEAIIQSGMAPKGDNAQAVVVKMQAGMELGMTPVQSMQSFVVVNGRLTMYGEAALGKIRASGVCEHLIVGNDGDGDARCGFVEFKRRDMAEVQRVTFTWAEAKRAGLTNKDTYKAWGDDMLTWRAVGRFAKRYCSDVLKGFEVTQNAANYDKPTRVAATRPERPALPSGPDPLLADAPFDAAKSAELDRETVDAERGDGKLL